MSDLGGLLALISAAVITVALLWLICVAGPKQDRREEEQQRLNAAHDEARRHDGKAREPYSWR